MPIARRSGAESSPASSVPELREVVEDRGRGRERLPAGLLPGDVEPEQRHGAVADELVQLAAGLLDGLADDGEIAVEQEHDVIGQPVVGERGEAANVAKQDRDFLLAAGRGVPRRGRQHPVAIGGKQRQHGEAMRGPELAGQPDIGRGADAQQRHVLDLADRRQAGQGLRSP